MSFSYAALQPYRLAKPPFVGEVGDDGDDEDAGDPPTALGALLSSPAEL